MTPQSVRTMLAEMDLVEMMNHSMMNHIINGMHYLCLHRSPKITLKLYLIERKTNDFAGFLLHPHTHRYAFDSTVLAGSIEELKFQPCKGDEWDQYEYVTELRKFERRANYGLIGEGQIYQPGEHYFNDVTDIHTLPRGSRRRPGPHRAHAVHGHEVLVRPVSAFRPTRSIEVLGQPSSEREQHEVAAPALPRSSQLTRQSVKADV